MNNRMIDLKDLYKGQTVWIIGKGPSLQYLTKEDIGLGPVITINQAILKVEEIGLPNPVYSMQKDGGDRKQVYIPYKLNPPECNYTSSCGDKCGSMRRPKQGATLLVHKHESLYCFSDYSPRYVFDWTELGLKCNRFSQVVAIKIGILMGCEKFYFVSFDAHVNGCLYSFTPDVGIAGEFSPFKSHVWKVKRHLKGINHEWITPKK